MKADDSLYLGIAHLYAKRSKAKRKQVGACLVTPDGVVLGGYNGTPSGWDNTCEETLPDGSLRTKTSVLHAEHNCILKAAREGVSTKGATIYITLQPCQLCSAMLAQAGILRIVYSEDYESASQPSQQGNATLDLSLNGIEVERIEYAKEENQHCPNPAQSCR